MGRLNHFFQAFPRLFQTPPLTPARWKGAVAVAVATDLLQMLLGPFGWFGIDECLDVVAMIFTWRLLGFHPLLLPTFILEFFPVTDLVPTWTACVAIVLAQRRREYSGLPVPSGAKGRVYDA